MRAVTIQTSAESVLSPPSWFGEVILLARYLKQQGVLEAARQRALPQTEDLPPARRRLDDVCAPGYTGRKRGQVVHTRTVISQAHSFQWLGSFGNRGNGRYRTELRKARSCHHALPRGVPAPAGTHPAPARWTVWHGGRALRPGWLRLCDPRQRLHRARSSTYSSASATPPRPAKAS